MTIRCSLLALCVFAGAAASQSPASSTPEALATLVMQRFSSGTPEEFAAVFPDSTGRVFMRESRGTRLTQLARVISKGPRRAVLLLGGVARASGNAEPDVSSGGNETNGARHFSGFYEAVLADGGWRITHQIPFDSANFIRSQRLQVDVDPATGIRVVDTLGITVGAPHGFGVRLNNAARLGDVRVDGKPVEHQFGGGVLWLDMPKRANAQLVVSYSLAAARPARPDSAGRAPAFGAFHNTDAWHPFFDYLSANHLAAISATVRIPADYYLTTTVPQTDTVRDGARTVYAKSLHDEFLIALIYDRDWRPRVTDFGGFRFESFTSPTYRHSHDSLAAATKRVYDLLAPRFGEPQFPSRYLAAVQNRALGAGGFNVRMNNAAIGGSGGGDLGSRTSQVFAHETGHAWTLNGTGRASNFVHEAWATFVEALMYRALYGADDERAFWERQRNAYMVGNDRRGFAGGFEGQQSILANYDNGRIHYQKGVWIFRAANNVMGDSAFDRGTRAFVDGMGKGPRGHEELIAAWSKAAGRDMGPVIMPWLIGKNIPDIDARVDAGRLILTQRQPGEAFVLPKLEVDLTTPGGVVRKTVNLIHRTDTLRLGQVGDVSEVRVDPDHQYLLMRQWGESVVRFELPADKVPAGGTVALNGNFLRSPIQATKTGDSWIVELPMTEGRYTFLWQITDPAAGRGRGAAPADASLLGTRTVRALQLVSNAYPGR